MPLAKATIDAISELARAAIGSEADGVRAFYNRLWLEYARAFARLVGDAAVSNRSRRELNNELFALIGDLLRL